MWPLPYHCLIHYAAPSQLITPPPNHQEAVRDRTMDGGGGGSQPKGDLPYLTTSKEQASCCISSTDVQTCSLEGIHKVHTAHPHIGIVRVVGVSTPTHRHGACSGCEHTHT